MAEIPPPEPFELTRDGVTIAGETLGSGPDVVLAHGLTATRRYVVMGSKALPRAGYRLTTYDARGHGSSSPADSYEYSDLAADLEAVLDHLGAGAAVVGGASMGAATAVALALRVPRRVRGLIQITPAHEGGRAAAADVSRWDALADALERGGVDGFLRAYDPPVDGRWRTALMTAARQRLERHEHPDAVAGAMRAVARSAAFESLDALESLALPALVVATRDEPDPGHPLRIARAYAERLPDARLIVEDEGHSPLAWQGARLSQAIAQFLTTADRSGRTS